MALALQGQHANYSPVAASELMMNQAKKALDVLTNVCFNRFNVCVMNIQSHQDTRPKFMRLPLTNLSQTSISSRIK